MKTSLVFLSSFLFVTCSHAAKDKFFNQGLAVTKQNKLLVVTKEYEVGVPNKISLYEYSLAKKSKTKLPLPETLQEKDVVQMFGHSKNENIYFFLFQTRFAGYGKPTLYSYSIDKKSWSQVEAEINCVNLNKIEVKKEELSLQCGEDYVHPPKAKNLSIPVANIRPLRSDEQLQWKENVSNDNGVEAIEFTHQNQTLKVQDF